MLDYELRLLEKIEGGWVDFYAPLKDDVRGVLTRCIRNMDRNYIQNHHEIVLLESLPNQEHFQNLVFGGADAVFFPREGSGCLAYYGSNTEAFWEAFEKYGKVLIL